MKKKKIEFEKKWRMSHLQFIPVKVIEKERKFFQSLNFGDKVKITIKKI